MFVIDHLTRHHTCTHSIRGTYCIATSALCIYAVSISVCVCTCRVYYTMVNYLAGYCCDTCISTVSVVVCFQGMSLGIL